MINFNLPEKLYVATKERTGFDTVTYPLGFATPWEDNTKAFLKRKETVDNWAGIKQTTSYVWDPKTQVRSEVQLPPHNGVAIIENKPVEGFTFDKSVSRWSTSNKYFRIQDPRGFTLEISAENLGNVLINGTINRGLLIGEYVWARGGGGNYLLSVESEAYKELTAPKSNLVLQVDDLVEFANNGKMQYKGKYYFLVCKTETHYEQPDGSFSFRYYSGYGQKQKQRMRVLSKTKDPKPWHIFVYPTEKVAENEYYGKKFVKYRSIGKYKHLGMSGVRDYDFTIPRNDGYNEVVYFFKTKKELDAFDENSVVTTYKDND